MKIEEIHILVVDDMESVRKNVCNHLKSFGYSKLSEAEDGAIALRTLESMRLLDEPVHLIICDWMMPSMNGIELLSLVRSDPATAKIPFLMVTAEGETQRIVAAIKAGASGYIIKPFTAETLKSKVQSILSKLA